MQPAKSRPPEIASTSQVHTDRTDPPLTEDAHAPRLSRLLPCSSAMQGSQFLVDIPSLLTQAPESMTCSETAKQELSRWACSLYRNRQTDRPTDRQTDRQTDAQKERERERARERRTEPESTHTRLRLYCKHACENACRLAPCLLEAILDWHDYLCIFLFRL